MTVQEFERVSAPPKTGEDAREERARILEAAALEIEVRGWTQGALSDGDWDDDSPVCANGAILCALGGLRTPWERAGNVFGLSSDALADWNDSLNGTDADEVAFLLRWRAEEIRDGR